MTVCMSARFCGNAQFVESFKENMKGGFFNFSKSSCCHYELDSNYFRLKDKN